MAKPLTRAQLVAELAALRESYQRLEERLSTEQARHVNAPTPTTQARVSSFKAQLAAAREMAARTGVSAKL